MFGVSVGFSPDAMRRAPRASHNTSSFKTSQALLPGFPFDQKNQNFSSFSRRVSSWHDGSDSVNYLNNVRSTQHTSPYETVRCMHARTRLLGIEDTTVFKVTALSLGKK